MPAPRSPVPSALPSLNDSNRAPHPWRRFWLGTPQRRTQLAAWLCCLWLAFFGSQWFRVSKDVAGGRRAVGSTAETVYLPPPSILRMASLGNQSFLADFVFLRATRYFVDHLLTDSHLPWIEMYLQAIWSLDAHNRTTYRWGSQVVKFGQIIDAEVGKRANRFARLGLEYFADDPWLYHEIAYNLHYTVANADPEHTTALRTLATKYLEVAYTFPSFQYDPNYLVSQYSRSGSADDSIRTALLTYANAQEDQRRELRITLEDNNKSGMAAELAWYDVVHRRDWPYLSRPLSGLIGPKRRLAPPLESWKAEAWYAEAPVDPQMLQALHITRMTPPLAERPPADEVVDDTAEPLPAAASATHS